MYDRYHITEDSFGPILPANWREIADFLNDLIDETVERMGEDDRYLHDELNDIWERYCNGDIPGAPEALDEEV